jgi:SAM-dependent methyltransferase
MSNSDQYRSSPEDPPDGIDTNKPSGPRVYDFFLGGKDNFAVDRRMAQITLEAVPDARQAARSNRQFLKRVVRHLASRAGIRQFLDMGSGLPTRGNVHEIAQRVAPGARVAYIDNDPVVLAHGRALLAKADTTAVVEADIRDPEGILAHPEVRRLVDLGQPVGLLLFAILHHLNDHEDPEGIAARLRDALPPGSYLAISHFHNPGDQRPEVAAQAMAAEKIFTENLGTGRWRTREEILGYFGDLELLEPGLVPLPEWRAAPSDHARRRATHHILIGGVARKT